MMPRLEAVQRLEDAVHPDAPWDALVVVAAAWPPRLPDLLEVAVRQVAEVDRTLRAGPRLLAVAGAPGRRLVLAPTGPLDRDHDDVRRIADAAAEGVLLARDAGARHPVLLLRGVPPEVRYRGAVEVAVLGALAALWEPLEAREVQGDDLSEPVVELGVVVPDGVDGSEVLAWCDAVEAGRRLARDLGGTEPERMTPGRMADLCRDAFTGTEVDVDVVSHPDTLLADYPMLMAVARASLAVPRHAPRVIRLSWEGAGPVERTLLLAGKGVSYDTGGADLKTGGHMAGMSRDKGGAGAVAGFVLAASRLAPPGLRIVAEIGAVRNSIGADSFVTDEILVSHAGVRVRVGNTDAEGRLVLADLLSHLRVEAERSVQPRILSVATLTGHAGIAVGPYTITVENGAASHGGVAAAIAASGEQWGEPVERSSLRREDFERIEPRSRAEDVISCNNKPSSQTPRGHQFPFAFLLVASGLDKHGQGSDHPIPVTHIDIGGSGVTEMDWQHGTPTGAPIVALAGTWLRDDGAAP